MLEGTNDPWCTGGKNGAEFGTIPSVIVSRTRAKYHKRPLTPQGCWKCFRVAFKLFEYKNQGVYIGTSKDFCEIFILEVSSKYGSPELCKRYSY